MKYDLYCLKRDTERTLTDIGNALTYICEILKRYQDADKFKNNLVFEIDYPRSLVWGLEELRTTVNHRADRMKSYLNSSELNHYYDYWYPLATELDERVEEIEKEGLRLLHDFHDAKLEIAKLKIVIPHDLKLKGFNNDSALTELRIRSIMEEIDMNFIHSQAPITEDSIGSYTIKHILEKKISYLTESELIVAMASLGFRHYCEDRQHNYQFNILPISLDVYRKHGTSDISLRNIDLVAA